jgi:hypothetical protein
VIDEKTLIEMIVGREDRCCAQSRNDHRGDTLEP